MREPDAWIDLTNFSPGIVHDLAHQALGGSLAGRAPGPDGAASIENTYRCITLAGGGLGPLPQGDWSYARPTLSADVAAWRVQFLAQGPVATSGQVIMDPRSTAPTHPVDFILAFEGMGSTGPNTRRLNWTRDRVFQDGATVTHVDSLVSTASAANANAPTYYNPTFLIAHATTFTLPSVGAGTLFGRQALTDAGSPIIVTLAMWPDPTSSGTAATTNMVTILGTQGRGLSHQGRAVDFLRGAIIDGPSATRFVNGDLIIMTQPGNLTTESTTATVVTQDTFSGIGVAASISASDLLLITHSGGAALVQGDLVNPTVRRMPGVTSTGGTSCIGTQTGVGYVYGVNRGGVYAWVGDSSRNLSAQLPDDCWIVPGHNILEYQGRFALWDNWILCPNNWLYDINSNGWWRLDDPSVKAFYEFVVSPTNGYLYANLPVWNDGGSQMSGNIIGYNRAAGATSWSWQSQPLARTRNRIVEVRDVDICCQGAGTIAVTLTARDGTTQSQTYTLSGSSTLTQYGRLTFAVQGADIKIRFVATGTGGTNPAPVLCSAHLGYNQRMHLGAG